MISSSQNNNDINIPPNCVSSSQNRPQTYKVIKLIGEGSFGKAYLVECIVDKTLCVIKTINIDSMDDQEKKETLLEAKILEKLDHSNIIRFREVFIAKKPRVTLNIVTDYADGGDLQGKIKSQKGKFFSETQILDWFTQICLALKHIHDKKILHRDLKSQNVFLTENGMVKLGDFGIAKCLECTLQKAMTVVGTPYYLSPEIVNNKPYSFKSDIWSLGVLLYEMAALKMPFDATSLPMLSLKIMKGSFSPLPYNFSKDLKNLVGSLLVVDQNKRPNINEILKLPIIKSRIKSFLNEIEYDKEFSHTIIHNFNVLKDKKEYNPNSRHNSNPENRHNQENVKKNVQNPNSNNKNVVVNNKPQVLPQDYKKREADHKEILEYIKKNDVKKVPKNQEKVTEIRKPSPAVNKNSNLNNNQVNSNNENGNQINSKNKINVAETDEGNPLKELMKKARAELKNKPKEDIIWMGKEKDQPANVKKEKEIKFPKVIIVEKDKSNNVSKVQDPNMIDINFNQNNEIKINDGKPHKEDEEIYNLNRYLNELAKIDNEEDEKDEGNINDVIDTKPTDDESNTREFNEVEDTNETNQVPRISLSEFTTDNSQIEELRIELENSLGFEVFKNVYKIVDEKTDPLVIKCDFELLKELIIKNLEGKYNKELVDSAIEKIPEVFAIVMRERISNI